MEELLRELGQSLVLRDFLKSRIPVGDGPGCSPCCKWILEDLELNGKLTGYPKDFNGASEYPLASKILHLHVELVGPVAESVEDGMELLPCVVVRLRQLIVGN